MRILAKSILTCSVTRYIVGYKKEESDALLKLLYDHIAFGADFQIRARWEKNTVVVWDVGQSQRSQKSFFSNSDRIA